MVYHDGSENVDLVIKGLSFNVTRSLVVAQAPVRPYNIRSHTPESAVLIANDPDSLVPSLRLWPLWNGRSRILLILDREEYAHKWLKSLWRWTRAVNVAAMIVPSNQDVQFFTWFPYQANDCSNVTQIVKIQLPDLYPEKIHPPLNNCPLTAVTAFLPPIVVNDFYGLEPRIFQILAQKLHMKATYVRLSDGMYVWMLLENGLPGPGMQLVWNNEVDLMFSMLTSWIITPYGDYVMPHGSADGYWWVPAEKPAPRATAIFRAFSLQAWTAVFIVCCTLFLILTLMSSFEKKSLSFAFLETVAVSLSLPSKAPSSKWSLLFVVIAYMYSLHITTGYQSSLIIFLSDVPRMKAIDTVEELSASDLIIQFHEGHRDLMTAMSELPVYAALNDPKRSTYGSINHLEWVANPGKHALLGAGLPHALKRDSMKGFHDEYGYPLVKTLREPFYSHDMRFCISRGHPLFSLIDRYIQMLVEGGFPQFFINEIVKRPTRMTRHLQPFGIENVQGPFVLLLALLGISFIAWLCELLVYCFWKYFGSRSPRRKLHRWAVFDKLSRLSNPI